MIKTRLVMTVNWSEGVTHLFTEFVVSALSLKQKYWSHMMRNILSCFEQIQLTEGVTQLFTECAVNGLNRSQLSHSHCLSNNFNCKYFVQYLFLRQCNTSACKKVQGCLLVALDLPLQIHDQIWRDLQIVQIYNSSILWLSFRGCCFQFKRKPYHTARFSTTLKGY